MTIMNGAIEYRNLGNFCTVYISDIKISNVKFSNAWFENQNVSKKNLCLNFIKWHEQKSNLKDLAVLRISRIHIDMNCCTWGNS